MYQSPNNPAENGLREVAVHRKVRGSMRSDETMEWFGNLFSCIAMWKAKEVDYSTEIRKYI